MNGFANSGGNGCLWILILLLILFCSQNGGLLQGIIGSSYLPVILAVLYCVCKNGGLCNLFGDCCK